MSTQSLTVSADEQRALERFYFFEARLLDERQYLQWLKLLTEDVRYIMPSRINVQVDNRERGQESMTSVDRELEGEDSMGCPHREESYIHLMLRAERAYKINSWSEHPPARTRRIVGNIELMARSHDSLSVISNFHLYYARPGCDNVSYSGQRRDTLVPNDPEWRIARREVVLDYANIQLPTLGLLF
ncbi:MAG: aromatic-ring-hydroxylating dioxygenase subunit beta [Halioglobus sp.]